MNRRTFDPILFALWVLVLMTSCDHKAQEVRRLYGERPLENAWPANSVPSVATSTAFSAPLTNNFYVIFDGSGSMSDGACGTKEQSKLAVAKVAVTHFLAQINAEAQVGLLAFDAKGVSERASLSTDRLGVQQAISNIRAGGGTPLSQAVTLGASYLTQQGRAQRGGYGTYRLVIITDGRADATWKLKEVVEDILYRSPIELDVIGFCLRQDHPLNQPGRVHYRSASSEEDLKQAFTSMLSEATAFDTDASFTM